MTNWHIEPDAAGVIDSACRIIHRAATDAIAARGAFHLVLSGGTTPLAAYHRLATSDQRWKSWTLYYGDERCVPADDPLRNSVQVVATGLAARVGRHLPIPTERGCAQAAAAYAEQLAAAGRFDLVLLGLGEDGHTASLFPGHAWPDASVFVINDAPKPPAQRVTLGVEALQNCRAMLALVTGVNKAAAVQKWRAGESLPIAQVIGDSAADVVVERNCLSAVDDQATAAHTGIPSQR